MATGSKLYDLPIIDAHTHTSGPDADGPPGEVVRCMDQCGVEMAFVFAPLLDVHGLQLRVEHYDDIRRHNDYISHFCSHDPERLLEACHQTSWSTRPVDQRTLRRRIK